ncbi:MAG: hypothetical protein MJK04_02280 [Psychrosphaera sp.]|nr:hypothetical protein [Psychrosphaera sp.]
MDGEPISGGDDPLPGTDDPLDTGDDSFADDPPPGDAGDSGVAGGDAPVDDEPDFVEDDTETGITEQVTPEQELANIIAERTGIATFSNATEVTLSSGNINSFEAKMNVNFDTGAIKDGIFSFDDGQGEEWLAVFDGAIYLHNIEVDINWARHGNNLAEGTIDSYFLNKTHNIFSEFDLWEIGNVNNKVNGSFELNDGNP